MSEIAVRWSGGFFELKGVFKLALPGAVGGEGKSLGGFSFGVERQELVGHVFERLADAGLARDPGGAAQFVERGLRAFHDAVALHQVHALEGDIQARVIGVAQEHELAAAALGFDQAQAFELADAVIHVNDVIAGLQFREVCKKAAGANLAAGAFNSRGYVEQIGIAVDGELGVWKGDSLAKGRADQNEGGGFRGVLRGEACGGFFGFAEHIRDFVLAADIGVALEFAEAGGGEIDGAAGGELGFDVGNTRGHVAMKTRAGARTDFKAAAAVLFEIELLEFDARGFRQGALPLGVVPVIVGDFGRIGVALAFVIFGGGFAEFFACFTQRGGFVQKDDRL